MTSVRLTKPHSAAPSQKLFLTREDAVLTIEMGTPNEGESCPNERDIFPNGEDARPSAHAVGPNEPEICPNAREWQS